MLCAVETEGWAFHNICLRLQEHLGQGYEFRIRPYTQIPNGVECDILAAFWWPSLSNLLKRVQARVRLFGVYDGLSWPYIPSHFGRALAKCDGLFAANARFANDIRKTTNSSRPVYVTPDGVDTDMFPLIPLPERFAVGWCGNSNVMGDVKGVGIIAEACGRAGVPFIVQDRNSASPFGERVSDIPLPQDRMSEDFYSKISAYVCMSSIEGTPNPPLEAMASGRVVVTTSVGVMPDVVQDGVNGFFCQRDSTALAERIANLASQHKVVLERIGKRARESLIPQWTWEERAKAFKAMFDEMLSGKARRVG